jgi:hypothetical protein
MKAHKWQHVAWLVTTKRVKRPASPTAELKEDRCMGLDGLVARNMPSWLRTLGQSESMNVGPCHHGMARPQVADGGTASYMEGSCE